MKRVAALGGVAYVVLFIAGILIAGDGPTAGEDDPPAKVISYWSDSGNRDKVLFAWLLTLLAVFCLIWFLGSLRRLLLQVDADGSLAWVASVGGTVYAACTLTGWSLQAAVFSMSDDTYKHQVFPSLIHAASDAGYTIHSAGGVGMAALIIATALATSRAGLIGRGVAVASWVVGVLSIFSIFFFPQLLLAIWIVAASVALYRTPPVVTARGVPAA